MLDPLRLKAREAKRLLVDGEVSAAELTKVYLDQIAAVEERVHAYIRVTTDNAAKYSTKIDREMQAMRGPLAGLPLAVKDNMVTEGVTTTCASRILHDYAPVYTATAVRKLWDAHVVMLGKTNLDEFAMGSSTENSSVKVTSNPWDLATVPGGSSGGSAAAVAAGEALWALGSDTGGSIRQPAALCGIVGMKPTYGAVSRYGLIAFASSLDQIGPLTRSVYDCALLLRHIVGKDPYDATSVELPFEVELPEGDRLDGLTVGIPGEYLALGIEPGVRARFDETVALVEELGGRCVEISLPHTEYGLPAYYIIAPAEASANLARFDGVRYGHRAEGAEDLLEMYERTRGEGFGAEVKRRIMIGTYALSAGYYDAYYGRAQRVRTLVRRDFARAFEGVDLIVSPTTPTVAFRAGSRTDDPLAMYMSDLCTIPVNLAGLPALSIPCGLSDGLPVGFQLIGPAFSENRLLKAAHALEGAIGFETAPSFRDSAASSDAADAAPSVAAPAAADSAPPAAPGEAAS
ncbi:MAG: Asp-tRNA(Asn)/Glu-tRNA(Gln) amidotransferase subunit GatA [Thermoleophilia bacterium]|nr:Asp-tRNA(Asn)/Glu-tRNA(Gln) amidotransferase subunit GatA [Thermoleophilia bacterium]